MGTQRIDVSRSSVFNALQEKFGGHPIRQYLFVQPGYVTNRSRTPTPNLTPCNNAGRDCRSARQFGGTGVVPRKPMRA